MEERLEVPETWRPREAVAVFVVHGTKKLLDRCGRPSSSDQPTTTTLGDWYATVIFWRPQTALFVNELTRIPVLVPYAPAKTLIPRFVTELGAVLDALGTDSRFTATETAEMTEHTWAKTTNRSVVGSLTELTLLANAYRDRLGGEDLIELSLRLTRTPSGPLRHSHGFPDRELQAIVTHTLEMP